MGSVKIIEGVNGRACTKCGEPKLFTEFRKKKGGKYGYHNICKPCAKEYDKKYQQENKEQIKEKSKKYYEENKEERKGKDKKYYEENLEKIAKQKKKYREENKEKIAKQKKKWREENLEKIAKQKKKYREENLEKIAKQIKKWREENKEQIKEKSKKYYEENKEKIKEKNKKYREENKEKIAKYREENKEKIAKYYEENKEGIIKRNNAYISKRKKVDPIYAMTVKIRGAIGRFWKGGKYSKSFEEMMGCNLEDFKIYISKQFVNDMSFENQGEWELDHKVPLSLSKTEEELIKLNHYSNFQPLWKEENLKKSDKLLPKHKKLMFELIGR